MGTSTSNLRCPVCDVPAARVDFHNDRVTVTTRINGDVDSHDHEATAVALAADPSRTRHPVAVTDRPGRVWADGATS